MGLTRLVGRRSGRVLTEEGLDEVQHADVLEKAGFVAGRMDALGFEMTYTTQARSGSVVVNVSEIESRDLSRALVHMEPVFQRGLSLGHGVAVAMRDQRLAGHSCPRGKALLGTICSVTLNGIFLKAGVPVTSRFGGLVEMKDGRPVRFTELVEYRGTSVDPLELFIRAGMTRVRDCAATGSGLVGASFREFPTVAYTRVQELMKETERAGMRAVLAVGRPNCPLLDVPVADGRTGMVVIAGLNPFAAMHEAGVPMKAYSLAGLDEITRFRDFRELALAGRRRVQYVE